MIVNIDRAKTISNMLFVHPAKLKIKNRKRGYEKEELRVKKANLAYNTLFYVQI